MCCFLLPSTFNLPKKKYPRGIFHLCQEFTHYFIVYKDVTPILDVIIVG